MYFAYRRWWWLIAVPFVDVAAGGNAQHDMNGNVAHVNGSNAIDIQRAPAPAAAVEVQGDNGNPHSLAPSPHTLYAWYAFGSFIVIAAFGLICYDEYSARHQEWSPEALQTMQSLRARKLSASMLLVGKSGVGKSYLANAIIGKDISPENDNTSGTFEVKAFTVPVIVDECEVGSITVWDTVGFFSTQSQDACVRELYKAKDAQCILLCISAAEDRLRDNIRRLGPILDRMYGDNNDAHWSDRTIIVVTQCNRAIARKSRQALTARRKECAELIPKQLRECGLSEAQIKSIPILSASAKGDKQWIPALIEQVLQRSHESQSMQTFAMLNPEMVNESAMIKLEPGIQTIVQEAKKRVGTTTRIVKTFWKIIAKPMKTVTVETYEDPVMYAEFF